MYTLTTTVYTPHYCPMFGNSDVPRGVLYSKKEIVKTVGEAEEITGLKFRDLHFYYTASDNDKEYMLTEIGEQK
jgi:hypothetical protein